MYQTELRAAGTEHAIVEQVWIENEWDGSDEPRFGDEPDDFEIGSSVESGLATVETEYLAAIAADRSREKWDLETWEASVDGLVESFFATTTEEARA